MSKFLELWWRHRATKKSRKCASSYMVEVRISGKGPAEQKKNCDPFVPRLTIGSTKGGPGRFELTGRIFLALSLPSARICSSCKVMKSGEKHSYQTLVTIRLSKVNSDPEFFCHPYSRTTPILQVVLHLLCINKNWLRFLTAFK